MATSRSVDVCEVFAERAVEQMNAYTSNHCSFTIRRDFPETAGLEFDPSASPAVWSSDKDAQKAYCNRMSGLIAPLRRHTDERYRALNMECGVPLPGYLRHRDGLVSDSPDCAAWTFPDSGCREQYGSEYTCFEGPWITSTGQCGKKSGFDGICYSAYTTELPAVLSSSPTTSHHTRRCRLRIWLLLPHRRRRPASRRSLHTTSAGRLEAECWRKSCGLRKRQH